MWNVLPATHLPSPREPGSTWSRALSLSVMWQNNRNRLFLQEISYFRRQKIDLLPRGICKYVGNIVHCCSSKGPKSFKFKMSQKLKISSSILKTHCSTPSVAFCSWKSTFKPKVSESKNTVRHRTSAFVLLSIKNSNWLLWLFESNI